MAEFETLKIEDRGAARIITVDRPKALNALNPQVIAELSRAIEALSQALEAGDRSVRGVIITGGGDKAFVAGADIAAMVDMDRDAAMTFASQGHAVGEMLANLGVPVIAAVNGFALGGGCELALACDFIIASEKAKFGQPEVKLGVIPGFGGTQRLSRRVGVARAIELCVSGEMIRADEALRIGLVNRVVAPEALLDTCLGIVATVAQMGPLAVAEAKRVVHQGAELPLAAANQLEVEAFAGLFDSADQSEGMRAFLDKRSAEFEGE
ncbi:enoyl-CoA hydratase/isomerase family protein [Pseudenhygromyxa sp. WMMC2535]|uniref:enoyl-CoA hydratase/isomerase family protein n=1 Tax=Pseudenhygromyxa sp. WMMC2535 TaxID=2712867 RepID=UPI001553D1C4|nr:enoyl-CoA hydratase-related protein [Pseudenhygromyxa sp. WMMC2535]NVB41554.1 enoyl-CoA hydratase/isomerase family protein [Pseudenhygromyxa sp. WMMC2535]